MSPDGYRVQDNHEPGTRAGHQPQDDRYLAVGWGWSHNRQSPAGGAQGQASDILIAAREIERQKEILNDILVSHTGQPLEKVTHDTDRDFYLDPKQAVEYGLIDEILTKPVEAPKKK